MQKYLKESTHYNKIEMAFHQELVEQINLN